MAEARDPELVRREIALEREQLARAVERLRTETMRTRHRIGSRLKVVPAVLAAAVVAFAGGRRLVRYALRRLRD
jgi:hypothetical protein